jgi:hypothetical protein
MKAMRNILIGLVVLVLTVYSCVRLSFNVVDINYRLTLEAMTPDGPKTGSGVIKVSYGSQWNMNGGGRRGDVSVTGEAVHLDLGRGNHLFVTLDTRGSNRPGSHSELLDGATSAQWLPTKVFGFRWSWGDEWELARQVQGAKATASRSDVPLIALPAIVTFHDLKDPMSVELVDPDNIAATFGEGYVLGAASLELTDAAPTVGIENILPWITRIDGGYLDGGYTSKGSPYGLLGTAFKIEGGKL